jgi:hypothetical protein
MTSLINPYFNKTPANEQGLIQGLITESIQINGQTVNYLPRELQNLDLVFGEDVISKFTTNLPIEMYVESSQGFEGQSELISKFGLEIRDQITFKVSVTRWETEVKKIKAKMWVSRPQEGDLIYDSITKKLFEIKFVDQDEQFHQLGKRTYAYKLKCELYQFSHENMVTGISALDAHVVSRSKNLLDLQLLQEDGSMLLQENGTSIIEDVPNLEFDFDTSTNFKSEAKIINFDVNNPFGEL